jgi:alpha-galactosidase
MLNAVHPSIAAALLALACWGAVPGAHAETLPLEKLELSQMSAGWGKPLAQQSIEAKRLSIGGQVYERGVGTHAESALWVKLDGQTQRFTAFVGVDDETNGKGSVQFRLYGGGRMLFDSGVMKGGQAARRVDVPLEGIRDLLLLVTDGGDDVNYDHADWADAAFEFAGKAPEATSAPAEERVILTPSPGPQPRLLGARIQGSRPGRPFLYRIPCTGKRPIAFAAENLPDTLQLDSPSGVVRGTTPSRPGRYDILLKATSDQGSDQRPLQLVVGDQLALTPPMGWNSWYIHYLRVSDKDMRDAADVMIRSGMADFGYQYVNIDDCWMKKKDQEPYRDARGAVLPNEKFPDMKGLADYIHGKGLKAGLYTSPGPWTCAGYVGAYQHEEIDARQFAAWGFDFLKYDWCSYSNVAGGEGLEQRIKPYRQMGDILVQLDRDIVYNLCQYGMNEVWKWGGQVQGNCWRTTGDLGLARGSRLPGFYQIGLANAQHFEFAKPGQWNDPDYILIGVVGDAASQGVGHPTTLTPNEQYSYMSMWCLMAAPLIFSGDMTKLDEFTLNILCNAEVIDIDQDELGQQARILRQNEEQLILVKPLADKSLAVGLFNLSEMEQEITVPVRELGVSGKLRVRDLWRQSDLPSIEQQLTARVPRHGVALVRLRSDTPGL